MRWFEDGRLRFAVGIEDTFVPQEYPGRRRLDEYELTQHYHLWHDDLGLASATGAEMIRWGIPWYRVEPEPLGALVAEAYEIRAGSAGTGWTGSWTAWPSWA